GGHPQRDQEVKEETEQAGVFPTFECFLAEGAARDGLENSGRRNVVTESEKNARVRDVKQARHETGDENGQQRFGNASRIGGHALLSIWWKRKSAVRISRSCCAWPQEKCVYFLPAFRSARRLR